MSQRSLRFMTMLVLGAVSQLAYAQDAQDAGQADADQSGSFSFGASAEGSDSGVNADSSTNADMGAPAEPQPEAQAAAAPAAVPAEDAGKSWIEQLVPVDGMTEIGAAFGVLFPSSKHNLQLESLPHQKIKATPELAIRGAWFPIRFVGVEGEFAAGASSTSDGVQSYPWAVRAHVMGQAALWRITPFALIGGGRLGNVSNRMGSDSDPLLYFGVGAKAFLTDRLAVRLDFRDNLTQKNNAGDGFLTHSPEVLAGVSLTLGRAASTTPCLPEDSDGDGLVDRVDQCPSVAGTGRNGCPEQDTDGDGVMDDEDKCVTQPGPAPDGCPPPDADGDGIPDLDDKCPNDKGAPPDGCPEPQDHDGDGITDDKDKCPTEPETKNGFEDEDGCPDVVPEKVRQFTGVIQGIQFDFNKASIRPGSRPLLDKAAAVLNEYPKLRVEISGHTDNVGTREKNLDLSKKRAESVKDYLVSKGVAAERIETRGAGPDEPVDSNTTGAGRQRNRRIEFKLISGS